jgi:hypothetical protein
MIFKNIDFKISSLKFTIITIQVIITISIIELGIFLKTLFLNHIKILKIKQAMLPNITVIVQPFVIYLNIILLFYFIINVILVFLICYKKEIKIYFMFIALIHMIIIFLYINILCGTFAPDMLLKKL